MSRLKRTLPEQLTVRIALLYLLRNMSRQRRLQLLLTAILMFAGAIAELVTIGAALPFLAIIASPDSLGRSHYGSLFVSLLGNPDRDHLLVYTTIFLVIATLIAIAIRMLLTWVSQKFVLRLGHDMGVQIYVRLLHQAYSFHAARNTSEVIAAVEKVQTVVVGLLMPGMLGITSTFIAILIIALLIAIDPMTATFAAVAIGSVYVVVSIGTRRLLARNAGISARSHTRRIQQLQEGLGGIRDILIDHTQPVFVDAFRHWDSLFRRAQLVNSFVSSSPRIIVEGVGIILIGLLALYMSRQPGGVYAALPVLGALAIGAQRLLPLLQQSYFGWSQAMGSIQSLYDVVRFMDVETTVPIELGSPVTVAQHPLQSEISFRNVTFFYGPDEPALRSITFEIRKGERIGIIGQTGSGKSTLLDVLMGLLEPQEGSILIDGVPLTEVNRSDLQRQIGHVPQSIYLADTSVAFNIAFGEAPEQVDLERVRSAAAEAHILEFVESLPDGFDTVIGERGVRLSGGQRQRVGLARAFYKNKRLLILDEATSALDDATEASVMRTIAGLGDDVTVVMIAHRLSTLSDCGRILRMQGGRIIQIGTFDEIVGPQERSAAIRHKAF